MLGWCTPQQLPSMWSWTCAGEMEQPAQEPSPQPMPQPAPEFRWAAASENAGALVKTSLRDIQQQEASAVAAAAASDKGASRTGQLSRGRRQALMHVLSRIGAEDAVCSRSVLPTTPSIWCASVCCMLRWCPALVSLHTCAI